MTLTAKAKQYVQRHLREPTSAPLALFAGEAAYNAGDVEIAVAVWSRGDDVDSQMLRLERDPRAPEEARRISATANAAFRKHFTELHIACVEEFAARNSCDVRRVRDAVWPLTHVDPVRYRTPHHRPVIFYAPDLPASPMEPNDRFDWIDAFQARWEIIRDEYASAAAGRMAMTPYVPASTQEERWKDLRGKDDWSAIHLFKEAVRTPFADSFPETVAALAGVRLVAIDDVPLEAFFSRLRPGARIPPHFGLTNTRMTVHLPLIVPDGCAIRVGDVVHEWKEGKVVAFDDSFEHEAWNRASSDRVVLIFETHHPDLTTAERAAIEHAYGVRTHWLKGRKKLLEQYASN